jgi:hypothetical protein
VPSFENGYAAAIASTSMLEMLAIDAEKRRSSAGWLRKYSKIGMPYSRSNAVVPLRMASVMRSHDR